MHSFLFLDCDGVMATSFMSVLPDGYPTFSSIAVETLNSIISQIPDLEIVISSTWRLGITVSKFQEMLNSRGIIGGNVVGFTPRVLILLQGVGTKSAPRGCEIKEYLNRVEEDIWPRHPELTMDEEYEWRRDYPYSYLILDDDGDMLYHQRKHFIQTHTRKGLQTKHIEKAIKILNIPVFV